MNKLATLIANGDITVEDLANAQELIERAELVNKGIEACKKVLTFPMGVDKIKCYSYTSPNGEYEVWGTCTYEGIFTCSSNLGGEHVIGECNLNIFEEVFSAFDNSAFENDLRRFLRQQIKKAKTEDAS